MSLDNTKLLDFLDEVDKELSSKIIVVAVGGTAMTLLKAKPSTIDIDFTIPVEFYDEFESAKEINYSGNDEIFKSNLETMLIKFFLIKQKK